MESVMNNFAGDHQLQEQVDWTAVLSGHCHDLWRAALLNPWPKTGEPAAQHAIFTMGQDVEVCQINHHAIFQNP